MSVHAFCRYPVINYRIGCDSQECYNFTLYSFLFAWNAAHLEYLSTEHANLLILFISSAHFLFLFYLFYTCNHSTNELFKFYGMTCNIWTRLIFTSCLIVFLELSYKPKLYATVIICLLFVSVHVFCFSNWHVV